MGVDPVACPLTASARPHQHSNYKISRSDRSLPPIFHMNRTLLLALVAIAFSPLSLESIGNAQDTPETPQLELSVQIPRLDVSEYHRPYVAIWIQDKDRKVVSNLAVWYQLKENDEGEGTKWLPDLRQWWRRTGRSLEMPVDGISSATRPAGKHTIKLPAKDSKLSQLQPGQYDLVVEASREVGGRELVTIPMQWPPTEKTSVTDTGKSELGEVKLTLRP